MSTAGPRGTQGWGVLQAPHGPELLCAPQAELVPRASQSSQCCFLLLSSVLQSGPGVIPISISTALLVSLFIPIPPSTAQPAPSMAPLPASTPQPIPIVTVPPVYLSLLPVSPSLPQYTPAWPKCPSHSPGIPQPSPSVTIIPSSTRQPAPIVIPFHPVHPSMNPIPSRIPQYEPHSFQYTPAYHPQCLPHSLTPPTPHPGVTPKPPKTQTQLGRARWRRDEPVPCPGWPVATVAAVAAVAAVAVPTLTQCLRLQPALGGDAELPAAGARAGAGALRGGGPRQHLLQ